MKLRNVEFQTPFQLSPYCNSMRLRHPPTMAAYLFLVGENGDIGACEHPSPSVQTATALRASAADQLIIQHQASKTAQMTFFGSAILIGTESAVDSKAAGLEGVAEVDVEARGILFT